MKEEIKDLGLEFGDYEKKHISGNTAAVWEAIAVYTDCNRPLPEWVLEYLSEVAKSLLEINKESNFFRQSVVDALQVKEKDFSNMHRKARNVEIYNRVEMMRRSCSLSEAYSYVAKIYNLSSGTVENIYKKMRSKSNKSATWSPWEEEGG